MCFSSIPLVFSLRSPCAKRKGFLKKFALILLSLPLPSDAHCPSEVGQVLRSSFSSAFAFLQCLQSCFQFKTRLVISFSLLPFVLTAAFLPVTSLYLQLLQTGQTLATWSFTNTHCYSGFWHFDLRLLGVLLGVFLWVVHILPLFRCRLHKIVPGGTVVFDLALDPAYLNCLSSARLLMSTTTTTLRPNPISPLLRSP